MAPPAFTILSACSGVGGLELGLKLALNGRCRTVCWVENDPAAVAILRARIRDGTLDDAPIWDDIATFPADEWRGRVDLLASGFPCQPVSYAGRRRGQTDKRWLWPAIVRVLRVVRPPLVYLENVPGLLRLGGWDVLEDLAALGYDAEWMVLGAGDVGAPHRRDRVFILAYCESGGLRERWQKEHWGQSESAGRGGSVADAESRRVWDEKRGIRQEAGRGIEELAHAEGKEQRGLPPRDGDQQSQIQAGDGGGDLPLWPPGSSDLDAWASILAARPDLAPAVESEVRRMAPGCPSGVDLNRSARLRCLGNLVVPVQGAYAFTLLARRLGVMR